MDISSLLQGPIGQQLISGAASKLGIDQGTAQGAVAMAVPFILKAMNKNAHTQSGAAGLANALEKDHDGSVLDDVMGFIGNGNFSEGQGILNHVLGQKQPVVEKAMANNTGVDTNQASELLKMAAPVVMGLLGKEKRANNVGQDGMASLLTNMLSGADQGGAQREMSMIEKMLDQDGDGSIADDVMDIGGKLLGSFFKK